MSSSTLVADWKHPRTSKAFTAMTACQGVTLVCVNNNTIPCTAREFQNMGKTRFTVTILDISPGWAYAPFKKPQGVKKVAKDPNAKPLFEIVRDTDGRTQAVKLFSFKKAKSNFDRDERDDSIQSNLYIGQVISFFVQGFMYEPKESTRNGSTSQNFIFPQEVEAITPFTVLEMQVMISNNQTEGGYGLKLQKVSLKKMASLYSFMGPESLQLLPETDEAAKALAEERARANPFIHSNLELNNVSFFAKAQAGSYVSSTPVCPGFYRVVGPNGGELFPGVPCVDVSTMDLVKHSNSLPATEESILDAITMLDFASAAGALRFYVVSARSYRQDDTGLADFRGVPLLDVEEFLRPVTFQDAEAGYARTEQFPAAFSVSGLEPLVFSVKTNAILNQEGPSPLCEDLSLVSGSARITRGYHISVGTVAMPDILSFAFNATGCPSANTVAFQRLDYSQRAAKRKEPSSPIEEGEV